ncbi:hypothetical protein D9611_011235 [Ephemerocybe angulata]|uniref:Uncharacterized protein n=1 Tax=Ephemerocybe angulata TaxID=980116 RepID=A0A8H5FJJ7_9AGAR|nr:hypothetical protein D9611_011235 [Tulosesus angulatus]
MVSRKKKRAAPGEVTSVASVERLPEPALAIPEILGNIVGILVEQLSKDESRSRNKGPPYWKRSLLPLLLVNRRFFNAAAGELWKDMHAFLPFARLLPYVDDDPILQRRGIDAKEQEDIWSRFMIYSSYTSNLSLVHDVDDKIEGPWLSYLLGTPSRPEHIFPRLKSLDIYCPDVTTCTLLPILAARLRGCQILSRDGKYPMETFVRFAVATLACQAERISTLRIEGSMLPGTMAYFADMGSLRDFTISSNADPLEMHLKDFLNLKSVPGLKRLALDYAVPTTNNVFAENYTPDIEECLKGDAHLPALEELLVSGDGLTQHMVARDILLPKTLRRLDLICREAGVRGHLIPFALRVYLERNQNLERLNIKWEYDPRARYRLGHVPTTDPRPQFFSNNPLYKDRSAQFLPALARQTSLTELKIDGLECFKDSLIEQICDIIPNFPNLKKLTLRPTLYGGFPPFTVLESIANSCPLLEWISMPISWANQISLPERIPTSPHKLTRLWVGDGRHPKDLRGSIAIGRYLHTLFPRVRHLCDPTGGVYTHYKEDGGGVSVNPNLWDAMDAPAVRSGDPLSRDEDFWKEIEVLVGSYHEARAQAIRELSLQ